MGLFSKWLFTTALMIAGIAVLVYAYLAHVTGIYLIIGPLLLALSWTLGAIFAGLSSPLWAVTLFTLILVAFIIIHWFNPFGIGAVI